MHCDSATSGGLICTATTRRNYRCSLRESNETVNMQTQWRSQRQQLQGSSRIAHRRLFTPLTGYRLVFLIAFSYFLQTPKLCSGSEDAASSFQRPPPPPPGPSYSTSAARTTNDYSEENRFDENSPIGQHGMPPPPPPPPLSNDSYGPESQRSPQQYNPSSSTQGEGPKNPSLPIHYEFPIADDDEMDSRDEDRRGRRSRGNYREGDISDDDDRDMPPATSSARKDLVTQYWSSKMGKAQIQTVVALVGYGAGNFVAKSTIGASDIARWTGYFWAVFMVVSTWFRTPMGELSRAIGLSLILVLQRTQRIRKEYPTWRYAAASIGIVRGGPRDARGRPRGPPPFPPSRNPWKYTPRSKRDPDFNMMYAIVSMAMVGSTVGGNLPFIPNWIGALVGAASFAFACTWQNSHRGDLARTMGMRVVRAVTELWEIQADLQIIPKATVVSSQVIDKAMILDRKHRVKDRFLSFANKGYEQASKVAEQIQKQQRGGNDDSTSTSDRDRRGRRGDDNSDLQRRDGRDRDWQRDRRDRGRFPDDDRFDERGDERRQRRRYRDDYGGDNDESDSRRRPDSYERRRSSERYEDEDNERDSKFGSRTRDEFNDGRDPPGEFESGKKSKGFFFGRK